MHLPTYSFEFESLLSKLFSFELIVSLGLIYAPVCLCSNRHFRVANSESDIIVSVTAFDETKYSQVYKDVGPSSSIYLAEHFFFDIEVKNTRGVSNISTIKLVFFNHRTLGPDSVIGQTELTFADAYRSKDHAILHQWAFLQHVSGKFDQVAGFFKYSLNITGAGDPRVTPILFS